MRQNQPAHAGYASVRIGDTVAVTHAGGLAKGIVIELGHSLSIRSGVRFGAHATRPYYEYSGGIVAHCVDAAGWRFVASIGWTHPDSALSIRRGIVLEPVPAAMVAS